MKLISIISGLLTEAGINYISPSFFIEFRRDYKKSEDYINYLSKIKKSRQLDDGKEGIYEEKLAISMAKKFLEIVLEKMIPGYTIPDITYNYIKESSGVSAYYKDEIKAFIRINKSIVRERVPLYYEIDPKLTRIMYKPNEYEKLYLWNPPEGAEQLKQRIIQEPIRKKPESGKKTASEKKPVGGKKPVTKKKTASEKKYPKVPAGKSTIALFRNKPKPTITIKPEYKKEMDSMMNNKETAYWNYVLKPFAQKKSGSKPNDEKKIESVIEVIMDQLSKEVVEFNLVGEDDIEKYDVSINTTPISDSVKKVEAEKGPLSIEAEINTTTYSVENVVIRMYGTTIHP
jgi:hypothetical protein